MAVEEAVYKLKVEQRAPLILHHMMGYKVYEIAKMLSIPEGTVKSRLTRARRNLKSIIKE
jgi:RNA polymerase sigma-70 factor (ECF subfamily)